MNNSNFLVKRDTHNKGVVSNNLFSIFKSHVGENKAILAKDLFVKVYNKKPKNDLESWLKWYVVSRSLNYLRKRSNCFIIAKNTPEGFIYFVLKNDADLSIYKKHIKRQIDGMKFLMKRAEKAVDEKWYLQKFQMNIKNGKM